MGKRLRKIRNCILLAGILVAVTLPGLDRPLTAEATRTGTSAGNSTTTIRDVQNQIQNTQNTIDDINDKIDALQEQQSIVDEKIDDLNSEIINTLTSIDMKEEELAEKEQELAEKETRLEQMQGEIVKAEEDYEAAKAKEEQQYSDMLVRIRYMYENGNTTLLGMVLQGDGLAGLLNRMDYMEKVYEYDRSKLEEFQQTKDEVQALWDALVAEQEQIRTDKLALEQDRLALEADKKQLEGQRSNLNAMLAQKKKESANYDAEIRKAQQEAAVAAKLLKQEQQQLKLLQEEANKPKPSDNTGGDNDGDTGSTGGAGTGGETPAGGTGTTSAGEGGAANGTDPADSGANGGGGAGDGGTDGQTGGTGTSGTGSTTTSGGPSVIDSAAGSDLGKQIARYACQFVGNPYVPGGTSLTNGADCSGFTYRVFSDFGYKLPRTSYEQRSAGVAVDYASAQPGDIICYDGHVAIYIGGGKIVHASTQKTGIKYGNADYRPILSVRRII